MLSLGRSCFAPQTVFELSWRFRKAFLLTNKFGTACAIELTADGEEWSELPIVATTATRARSGTSVIRKSRVPPRAWVGLTTNWSQPDTFEKSKAETSDSVWQILYCTTNCIPINTLFQKNVLLTSKFRTACAIKMTVDREDQVILITYIGATPATRTRQGCEKRWVF